MIIGVNSPNRMAASSARARPLSVEERQASIIDAVMPLLVQHGRDVTSRQIAEAAGVAEGTIFRAFGDKDSLIEAAVAKFLDSGEIRLALQSISPELSLDDKMLRIVELMLQRFSDVFRVMAAIGVKQPPKRHEQRHEFAHIVAEVLAPELAELNWSAERTAHVIRLITFSASLKEFNAGMEFDSRELATIILYGVAGKRATELTLHPTESQDS
jgi:AcrR family transcriptional regulator